MFSPESCLQNWMSKSREKNVLPMFFLPCFSLEGAKKSVGIWRDNSAFIFHKFFHCEVETSTRHGKKSLYIIYTTKNVNEVEVRN